MSLLEIRNVSKVFNGDKNVLALKNINFSVNENEFVAIVGPSGCGKSTLFRMIGGLDSPTSGEILFKGEPITGPTPEITMVFQNFALLPWKTALENVELPLIMHGINQSKAHSFSMKFLKVVGLKGFENVYPIGLSGGMKQRVGIARALALQPAMLLMDEPFSALDALTAEKLRRLVMGIWYDKTDLTNTFIMVTHLIDEAVFMADRIIVLSSRPGRVVADLKVDMPRPRVRYLRSLEFFRQVDIIKSIIETGRVPSKGGYGEEPDLAKQRRDLITNLESSGYLKGDSVRNAMLKIKRELFLPLEYERSAYLDVALPIPGKVIISPPHLHALFLSDLKLKPGEKVLEVGTGSGILLAYMKEIVGKRGKVYGIEHIPSTYKFCVDNLVKAGYKDVKVFVGDGRKGLEKEAPFDKIAVSALTKEIPKELIDQLKPGGVLVAPVGTYEKQEIKTIKKTRSGRIVRSTHKGINFAIIEGVLERIKG